MITEKKLDVGVEGVEVGLFGKPVNVVKERVVVRVQAARVEDGLLIRRDLRQGGAEDRSGFGVLLIGEKGLSVGKGQYYVVGRYLHRPGELLGGGGVTALFKGFNRLFEVGIGKGGEVRLGGGFGGELCSNVGKSGVVNGRNVVCRRSRLILHGLAFAGVIVVVRVVVVSVASDFACDGIVAVPGIGVTAVPVVAERAVTQGPITAQADKDVLAVVVRIAIRERGVRSPVIVQ